MLTRSGKFVKCQTNSLPAKPSNGRVPKLSQSRSKQLQRAERKWASSLPALLKSLRRKLHVHRTRQKECRRKLTGYYRKTIKRLVIKLTDQRNYSKELAVDLRNLWNHDRCDALTNLPDEVMTVVFAHLGYNHQQRLIRVSLRWKHIMTAVLDHLYLDKDIFDEITGFGSRDFRREFDLDRNRSDDQRRAASWKYHCPAVQQISLLTNFKANKIWQIYPTAYFIDLMSIWAKRYPNLGVINFAAMWLRVDSADALENLAKGHPAVTITIRDARVFALPDQFFSFQDEYNMLRRSMESTYRYGWFPPGNFDNKLLDQAVNHFCAFPTSDFAGVAKFRAAMDRAVWPYDTDEQVEWLSNNAPNLPEAALREVFKEVNSRPSHDNRCPNQLCGEHDKLCSHLPVAFYRDKLDGKVRNVLVALIRYFQISSEDMPQRCEMMK